MDENDTVLVVDLSTFVAVGLSILLRCEVLVGEINMPTTTTLAAATLRQETKAPDPSSPVYANCTQGQKQRHRHQHDASTGRHGSRVAIAQKISARIGRHFGPTVGDQLVDVYRR